MLCSPNFSFSKDLILVDFQIVKPTMCAVRAFSFVLIPNEWMHTFLPHLLLIMFFYPLDLLY